MHKTHESCSDSSPLLQLLLLLSALSTKQISQCSSKFFVPLSCNELHGFDESCGEDFIEAADGFCEDFCVDICEDMCEESCEDPFKGCVAFRGVDEAIGPSVRLGEDEQKPPSPKVDANMDDFSEKRVFLKTSLMGCLSIGRKGCERKCLFSIMCRGTMFFWRAIRSAAAKKSLKQLMKQVNLQNNGKLLN